MQRVLSLRSTANCRFVCASLITRILFQTVNPFNPRCVGICIITASSTNSSIAVHFFKEWVTTTTTTTTTTMNQKRLPILHPMRSLIIVQERVNTRKLDDWYATDYAVSDHPSTDEEDEDERMQYKYGAKIRHVTNLIEIWQVDTKPKTQTNRCISH